MVRIGKGLNHDYRKPDGLDNNWWYYDILAQEAARYRLPQHTA